MVRLKDGEKDNKSFNEYHFNSSMVRLKKDGHWVDVDQILFQFQYGAIEGRTKEHEISKGKTFQFQYGAIEGWGIN